jgi:hypothetical protein
MKGTSIEKRFKILFLLTLQLEVLEDKMAELADKIDEGHPMALEALTYYEDKIIETLEK